MKPPQTNPLLAVGYLRVSKSATIQELGLDSQRDLIQSYAAQHGLSVVAWHQDVINGSATIDARTGLLDAVMSLHEHKAGLLIVAKWDRFSRDPVAAALAQLEISKAGASVISADGIGNGDDPTAELVRGMVLVVAKFEKAMIQARIKAALKAKIQRGESTGKPPRGYRTVDGPLRTRRNGEVAPVKILIPDDKEQELLALIKQLRSEGLELKHIAEYISEKGYRTRKGKPYTYQTVSKILIDLGVPHFRAQHCKLF